MDIVGFMDALSKSFGLPVVHYYLPQHVNLSRRGRFLQMFGFLSPFCSLRVFPLSCLRVVFDFLHNMMYFD